jgi:ribonuclease G
MPKEILISVEPQEKRVAVVKDGRLEEFSIERPQDKTIVGNIYKGVIDAVLPAIGAAFVDVGLPKKGFLYMSEIETAYELPGAVQKQPAAKQSRPDVKKGQEILVQVVKESFGTKGPRLSSHIGLAGRYLVLMPQDNKQVGVSRRIDDDEERKRLRETLKEVPNAEDVGFIVRTAAKERSKKELQRDAQYLLKLWDRLKKVIAQKKGPALIYDELDLSRRVIRDSFTDEVSKLIVDSKPEYYRLQHFMRSFLGHMRSKVELYRGENLFADKEIERQISGIFEKKVYLKSKAYLIIEPTEGLVVIDVNSGGFTKKIRQEEAAFRINCEAAIEAAHQLMLRDLGGIIVIDFIDMQEEGHRREVLRTLKDALSEDKAKYDILGISKFGLVEMTRERVHKTVQMLSYQECPYCQGKGKVRSPVTTAINALKELKRHLKVRAPAQVNLAAVPIVIEEILKEQDAVRNIERRYRTKINLISNPALHFEEFKIS